MMQKTDVMLIASEVEKKIIPIEENEILCLSKYKN